MAGDGGRREDFDLDGYSIEFHDRDSDTLIVTFPSASTSYAASPRDVPAWGQRFVGERGYSALHVKTNLNCWYRRPQLYHAFKAFQERGLFDGYRRVVTYGGSMGGYGALVYAGVCGATHCLSLNPQVMLGPTVRDWEQRFIAADAQNWGGEVPDVNTAIADVKHLVTVHDPHDHRDSRHIAMMTHPRMVQLHLPFVGHRIPWHLQQLGQLSWLFDAVVEDRLDRAKFYRRIRNRRSLEGWREVMLEKTAEGSCRRAILMRHCPQIDPGIAPDIAPDTDRKGGRIAGLLSRIW